MSFFCKSCAVILLTACLSVAEIAVNPYMVDLPRQGQQISGLWLDVPIRSKPTDARLSAQYELQIVNTNDEPVSVELIVDYSPKNTGTAQLSGQSFVISALDTVDAVLTVFLTERIPIGSYESVEVYLEVDGEKSKAIKVSTVRNREHPFTLVTNEDIGQIKVKTQKFDWAKKSLENILETSKRLRFDGLNYPQINRKGYSWKGLTSRRAEDFWIGALAYAISGEQNGRDKAIDFLRAVACPKSGYPTTLWATRSTAYVHEGEFFTLYSAIYDLLYNEPQLTDQDHKNIQDTLRLFLYVAKQWHKEGDIGNWVTVPNAAALIASLVLQDVESYYYFINCYNGFDKQLAYGIMGDGWWLEGASNYNYVVVRWYGYAAIASDNWGYNLFDRRVPAKYQSDAGRRWKNGWLSMNFDVWGPPGGSYRNLQQLYDSVLVLMDEKGYTVANNDSRKMEPNTVFELAYRYYKDPSYAWVLSNLDRQGWDSLVYGVDLPEKTSDPRSKSGYAANVGVTALRSQAASADTGEQIEAYLKWGTHGGWHGHFDRTNLLALRRHGKDLFFSQPSWFGYGSNMYKAWVQPSISHNMVIVDEYQQEPVESEQLLFYAGDNLQVSAVETNARWQEKMPWDINDPGDLDPENMDKMVDYGDNQPVLQRRLLAVTDHYVVVADYLKGQNEHTFDWLLHPVGYIETIGNIRHTGYLPRMKDDKASSYYYITNCDIYAAQGRIINRFKDENLNLDVHTFLTEPAEMAIGTFPFHLCRQPVSILKDGEEVFNQTFMIDSCSEHKINVDISGASVLELRFAKRHHSTAGKPGDYIAFAIPQVITENGKIELRNLDYTIEGAKPADYGIDYEGRKIVISGTPHDNALMVEPADRETVIKINLEGLDARSFYGIVGAVNRKDWHENERKTLRFRSKGDQFKLISILEPYEDLPQITNARLLANNTLSIQLANGYVQELRINELSSPPRDDISVNFAKLRGGRIKSTERAENQDKRLLFKDDFDQSLDNWVIEQAPGGSVQLRNGTLEINDAAGCTVWFKHKLESSVSIEYDVVVVDEGGANDRVSDLNCFWMAKDPENPDNIFAASVERGGRFANYDSLRLYYVGYAANNNTTTRFRRYPGDGTKPLLPEHDLKDYQLKAGEKLQVRIVSDGSVNQYWINGEKIFNFNDPNPFTEGYFGFRTVRNRMRISNFRVYQLNSSN